MSESFLSNSEKIGLGDVFYNIHDTFSRPIVMFKSAEQVTISTNPDFNPYYSAPEVNDVVQTYIISGVFQARIKYNPKEDLQFMAGGGNDQVVLTNENGLVRIKLDASGAAYLNNANRIKLDGDLFEPITSKRPHGLFKTDFFTFYLRKVN